MTLRAFATQERRLPILVGEVCSRAGVGGAGALLLDFGALLPPDEHGRQAAETGLVAECPWRLETISAVIVGYLDDDDTIEQRVQACTGRQVIDVGVFHPSYTVAVSFEGDLSLWIFPCDSKDYVDQSPYPSSPWYVLGTGTADDWEDATLHSDPITS